MSLITLVKAGNITNLSNARYCAGMGVEIIGFPIDGFEDINKINEIKNWITGVKIALELSNNENIENIKQQISIIQPDYIQLNETQFQIAKELINLPFIVTIKTPYSQIKISPSDYFLLKGGTDLKSEELAIFCLKNNVLLGCTGIKAEEVIQIIENIQPAGIELIGENEISPGLKSFEEFSETLELLEDNS